MNMSPQTKNNLKILIVGAGIAGPTCGAFLKEYGFNPVLVERAPEFKNIGYVMGMWPMGRRILHKLGLETKINAISHRVPWLEFASSDGSKRKRIDTTQFDKYGSTSTMLRTDLHKILTDKALAVGVDMRLGTEVTSVRNLPDKVIVEFNHEREETFDLVVVANGAHSPLRDQVFGAGTEHSYKWDSWIFWVKSELYSEEGLTEFSGDRVTLAIYPLNKERSVAVVMSQNLTGDFPPRDQAGRLIRLREVCKSLGGIVPSLLDAIGEDEIFYDHMVHVDLPKWYEGRVVLVGDAQHAMSPLQGTGASIAMEDGYVLARELNDKATIEQALQSYSRRRSLRMKQVHRLANELWAALNFSNSWLLRMRNMLLPFFPIYFAEKEMDRLIKAKL